MEYKLYIDYASVEVYEDTYEDGEGQYVNSWDISEIVGDTYDDVDALITAINKASGVFSTDKSDYYYIDGRIDTAAEVNVDNYEPTEDEYALWKRGELMLYAAHLSVGVTMVPTGFEHEMTEEEAEAFGLEVY